MITFLYGRRSARLWACGAGATVSFALFLHLLPTWGVALSGRQEKLGTLFQQTARFVRDYPLFRVAHSWSPDMPNLFHLQAVFPNVPCGMSALASLPLIGWVADMGFYVPFRFLLGFMEARPCSIVSGAALPLGGGGVVGGFRQRRVPLCSSHLVESSALCCPHFLETNCIVLRHTFRYRRKRGAKLCNMRRICGAEDNLKRRVVCLEFAHS